MEVWQPWILWNQGIEKLKGALLDFSSSVAAAALGQINSDYS